MWEGKIVSPRHSRQAAITSDEGAEPRMLLLRNHIRGSASLVTLAWLRPRLAWDLR
jgi:hypothetical protein